MGQDRKKTVHIISHTHWDREWYLNSKYVNRWIPIFFDALFRMLEKEPEYRFVLDGQTSILDDCYGELKNRGESVEQFVQKLKRYVKEGRIILGPYYLQPDWQLISGEALVRNMLYGNQTVKEMGGKMSTGWLLDNFGQVSQAPQIHEQFGMQGIVVWRGVEFEPEHLESEFEWCAPDGTKMPCVYLLSSYRNAMRLADCPEIIYGRIRNEVRKIAPFATTDHVLLMNGYDQEMNPDDILPYIKDGKADFDHFIVKQSTPDDYMQAVIAGLKNPQRFYGALYSGRYISVFPGILSSRMYLKTRNWKIQRKLENQAEPLAVMSYLAGDAEGNRDFDTIWKLLLKNYPHDSISGVSVDDVHTDMEDRFDEVEKELDACLADSVKEIASRIDTTAFAGAQAVFQVLNTYPATHTWNVFLPCKMQDGCEVRDRDGAICQTQQTKGGIFARVNIPAFGYETLGVYEKQTEKVSSVCVSKERKLPVLENAAVRICFEENGSFNLTDKRNGEIYRNMGYLEDCADNGDEYNFSYAIHEEPRTTLQERPKITLVEEGELCTTVKIAYEWRLPAELSADRNVRSEIEEILPVVTYVTLEKDSPAVRMRTVLRNRCRDHRIRVMFPTKITTGESLAQTQFDITSHPIVPEVFDNSKIPEEVKRIIIGARESKPITQFPQRDFVTVSDGIRGIAVFNQGLPEYEVLPKDTTIALTLFRSVGWLARTDLNTRIGDAGPQIYTPDAQCLRDMEFSYELYPMCADIGKEKLMEQSMVLHNAPLTVKTGIHRGRLPAKHTFFCAESAADICVTAIKKAQDQNGFIIRLFHAGDLEEEVQITFHMPVLAAFETNLAEENRKEVRVEERSIFLKAAPKRIKTLRILLDVREYEAARCEEINFCTIREEKENFESYGIPAVVTKEDIEREAKRAEALEREYKEQVQLCGGKKEALHRAALEGRLSWLFTWKKQKELIFGRKSEEFAAITQEMDADIQKLADELNLARIKKRAGEYISDFYAQSGEEESQKEE